MSDNKNERTREIKGISSTRKVRTFLPVLLLVCTLSLLPATIKISGRVTHNGNPLPGVTLMNLPGNPVTDANGEYSVNVTSPFSATVTPFLTGFGFNPPSRMYSWVTGNQNAQDFFAYSTGGTYYSVSGTVTYGGSPLSGVVMNGLPGNPVTNIYGQYTAAVLSGWSGTVAPTLAGYVFDPSTRSYTDVNSHRPNENFTAGCEYTISGCVTSGGSGLQNVFLSGLPGDPVTNSSGDYSVKVPSGWNGTATPVLSGYTFDPVSRSYSGVDSDQTAQNYTATPVAPDKCVISGRVTFEGSGLAGVVMTGLPANPSTNSAGDYSVQVDKGWSGAVVPIRAGYTFSPDKRIYTSISTDQSNQDYTAYSASTQKFTISGQVTTGGSGMAGVVMTGLPENPVTDASGHYASQVTEGWSGTVKPVFIGYAFIPGAVAYNNVQADMVQNFTGQYTTHTVHFYTGTGGTISGDLDQTVPHSGAATPVTAIPDPGYQLLSWTDEGGYYNRSNPVVVSPVERNMNIRAGFTEATGGRITEDLVILHPSMGAQVQGVFMVVVDTGKSFDRIEFYVDGQRKARNDSRPSKAVAAGKSEVASQIENWIFFEWDTRGLSCDWHRLKVTGYSGEDTFVDEVQVMVRNVEVTLTAERMEDKGLMLRRDFGRIEFTSADPWNVGIWKCVLYRAAGNNDFAVLREIEAGELVNGKYSFDDAYLDKETIYRYKVEVWNTNATRVGFSEEKTL